MSDITVGWIGIGNMGWPMARNAKKAGVDIAVFDLDQDKLGRFADEFDAKRASSLAAGKRRGLGPRGPGGKDFLELGA